MNVVNCIPKYPTTYFQNCDGNYLKIFVSFSRELHPSRRNIPILHTSLLCSVSVLYTISRLSGRQLSRLEIKFFVQLLIRCLQSTRSTVTRVARIIDPPFGNGFLRDKGIFNEQVISSYVVLNETESGVRNIILEWLLENPLVEGSLRITADSEMIFFSINCHKLQA